MWAFQCCKSCKAGRKPTTSWNSPEIRLRMLEVWLANKEHLCEDMSPNQTKTNVPGTPRRKSKDLQLTTHWDRQPEIPSLTEILRLPPEKKVHISILAVRFSEKTASLEVAKLDVDGRLAALLSSWQLANEMANPESEISHLTKRVIWCEIAANFIIWYLPSGKPTKSNGKWGPMYTIPKNLLKMVHSIAMLVYRSVNKKSYYIQHHVRRSDWTGSLGRWHLHFVVRNQFLFRNSKGEIDTKNRGSWKTSRRYWDPQTPHGKSGKRYCLHFSASQKKVCVCVFLWKKKHSGGANSPSQIYKIQEFLSDFELLIVHESNQHHCFPAFFPEQWQLFWPREGDEVRIWKESLLSGSRERWPSLNFMDGKCWKTVTSSD